MATVTPEHDARPFEHLVLDFLAYLEFERGLSRNTLEAYRSDLLQFGRFLAERVGGDLARTRRRGPRRGRAPRTRQGLEGARGAGGARRGGGHADLRGAGEAAALARPPGAEPVRELSGRASDPPGPLQDRAPACDQRGPRRPHEPYHAQAHLRDAPARGRLRPALRAGDARPRRRGHD